ncbi:MAG: methylmalonyl-CoA epimerase [Bdellovibrionales bacterium]|nr:methylmalonyl-CoA epimerase [Bdellovibrionales bacterium]
MELDHIGIAVNSLEEAKVFYEALGWKSMPSEVVESEKVKVGFLNLENNCALELLESTSNDGPIAKFIEKRGTGIHHICLRVKNIQETLKQLKEKNIQLLNSEPKLGAHNCLVAFIHPKSTGGVLIELSQPQGDV